MSPTKGFIMYGGSARDREWPVYVDSGRPLCEIAGHSRRLTEAPFVLLRCLG